MGGWLGWRRVWKKGLNSTIKSDTVSYYGGFSFKLMFFYFMCSVLFVSLVGIFGAFFLFYNMVQNEKTLYTLGRESNNQLCFLLQLFMKTAFV